MNRADGSQDRWRVHEPEADQDRLRLPSRPAEIRRAELPLPHRPNTRTFEEIFEIDDLISHIVMLLSEQEAERPSTLAASVLDTQAHLAGP